jgi:glutamate N-acetyltransferase / amino-acid N-acetyltransferase
MENNDLLKEFPVKGFLASGVHAGLKDEGLDLGMICSEAPATAAAVFTSNRVKAAPVLLAMEKIASGRCRCVIVNSGNANCCVGPSGMEAARRMSAAAAGELGIGEDLVIPASTGVIGRKLPIEKIEAAVPALARSLSPGGMGDFAKSIMTTDTRPKITFAKGDIDGKTFWVAGAAKGSGMIHPDMATMLCFVCSDIDIPATLLKESLQKGAAASFNRITVDGDTSTNDMALTLANGMSGARVESPSDLKRFRNALDAVLLDLAQKIVEDGEGASKMAEIIVKGARSDREARAAADAVAGSSLVKTAFAGQDPNWGRIMAALGRSGAQMDPDRIDIYFDDVPVARNGAGLGDEAEKQAAAVLEKRAFSISANLNMGSGRASVFTCDLTAEYVAINADYTHRT